MRKYLLIIILLLAFFLRFWRLGDYPALNADEAAIGYNAYSLLLTGKDEHGNPWPIHFQSFNDFKPGLYFYIVLPFIKFIGLNVWAVRIPSAFLGVMTIFIIYHLIKELFRDENLAIVTSFFLSISPWHIHFSRGGWEVNVATFFIVLGLYLFIKGKNNLILLMLSALCYSLSLYAYHSARIVVPLLIMGTVIIYKDLVERNTKTFFIAGLIFIVALMPLIKDLTKGNVMSRAAGVGIFADPGPMSRINEQRGEHINFTSTQAKILHNKVVNYTLAFLENWSDHFHGEFLFLSGDVIQRNRVPETGEMYLLDIFWLIIGLIVIVNKFPKEWSLITWWLIIAPTASALTFQSPHALRSQNMVIPLVIISSFGFISLIKVLRKNIKTKKLLSVIYIILSVLLIWQFARYEHMYWIHMSKEYPFSSQYGLYELTSFIKDNQDKYENVVVTNKYDQPYILFLFYLKYPPEKFQNLHELTKKDTYGFSTVEKFDKYIFKDITWDQDRLIYPKSIIVGTNEEIPRESNIINKIYGENGYLYFKIVAN